LHRERARLAPGRSVQLAAAWITQLHPAGGSVQVSVVERR
jgi:hypothetical protein